MSAYLPQVIAAYKSEIKAKSHTSIDGRVGRVARGSVSISVETQLAASGIRTRAVATARP